MLEKQKNQFWMTGDPDDFKMLFEGNVYGFEPKF